MPLAYRSFKNQYYHEKECLVTYILLPYDGSVDNSRMESCSSSISHLLGNPPVVFTLRIRVCPITRSLDNLAQNLLLLWVIGHLSYEGSYKITVSACPSVCLVPLSIHQFGIFLRNGSIVFSAFGTIVDNWSVWKLKESFLPGKFNFWKILSLVFLENDLKLKIILLLIFHRQFHIWKNSGSGVMDQNSVSQSNCRIL